MMMSGVRYLARWLIFGASLITTAVIAAEIPISILAVPVYLHLVDGRWSATLEGDINDPATELIEVTLADGSLRVLASPMPPNGRQCLTKMKDRTQFGYLVCNSAFYSANVGTSSVATAIRGVLSLGILTVSDAASGNTGFTVYLDQASLDAAGVESKAVELARRSALLVQYRQAYSRASNSRQVRDFIARYEGAYDPESLVAKAQGRLSMFIEQEALATRQAVEAEVRRAEAERQQRVRQQIATDALMRFRTDLRPGDRVKIEMDERKYLLSFAYGMVVEVKPPLVYLQWEPPLNAPSRWVRVADVLPPQ